MVLKYFLSKLLMLIYEKHNSCFNNVLVIFEDTKGKTRYKICKSTTDKLFTYNGLGHYIILINRFYENGYYCEDTIYNLYHSRIYKKKKIDVLNIVDFLIKLFN